MLRTKTHLLLLACIAAEPRLGRQRPPPDATRSFRYHNATRSRCKHNRIITAEHARQRYSVGSAYLVWLRDFLGVRVRRPRFLAIRAGRSSSASGVVAVDSPSEGAWLLSVLLLPCPRRDGRRDRARLCEPSTRFLALRACAAFLLRCGRFVWGAASA